MSGWSRSARIRISDLGRRCQGSTNILASFNIAPLVAEAFHGARPEGMEVDHVNDDKADDRAENLQWLTPSANRRKAARAARRKHGRVRRGWGSRIWTRLPDEMVELIRSSSESGYSLSRRLGISESTISRIRNGKRRA